MCVHGRVHVVLFLICSSPCQTPAGVAILPRGASRTVGVRVVVFPRYSTDLFEAWADADRSPSELLVKSAARQVCSFAFSYFAGVLVLPEA